ncbi:hypothetical protein [Sphingobium sp. WCS2017Hpa-17]|uniref:hypothetical protein n=1 Tax=Sphingobium sp. WCS2017Hpa-17 TaxID=3073638 RepID=UPI002889BB84|nr:hypothetical protein [Sphingobium sp. WCS2017Hpa-17]
MIESRKCSTCAFWRAGATSQTIEPVDSAADSQTGTCEFYPPSVVIVDGLPVSVQPTIHGARFCNEWRPQSWFDFPDDDDQLWPDPDPPEPDREKVRRLFPNPPPRPVAA